MWNLFHFEYQDHGLLVKLGCMYILGSTMYKFDYFLVLKPPLRLSVGIEIPNPVTRINLFLNMFSKNEENTFKLFNVKKILSKAESTF